VRGVITILAFILAGCVMMMDAPPDHWTKAGSRYGDLAVDLYVCEKWSRTDDHIRDCMKGHGWTEVASGP
jgi:hypothetical protein